MRGPTLGSDDWELLGDLEMVSCIYAFRVSPGHPNDRIGTLRYVTTLWNWLLIHDAGLMGAVNQAVFFARTCRLVLQELSFGGECS